MMPDGFLGNPYSETPSPRGTDHFCAPSSPLNLLWEAGIRTRNHTLLDNVFVLGFIVAMSFALIGARRATPKAAPAANDQDFASEPASGGMLEVKPGELAQSKGSNPR
jgi:hypothetical protein